MSIEAPVLETPRPAMHKPDEPIYEISKLGEGLALKSRKTIELTQSVAEHFLELPQFVGDRALQENHVMFLSRQMDAGSFRWEHVNLISCFCDGREYRMNGQHCCWALIYADAKKLKGVRTPISWLKYEAKTEQDMRQLYATIDRGRPRNRAHVVISYLAGREEFPGYPKGLLRELAQGLSFWLWEEKSKKDLHTADEVAYLMLTDYYKTSVRVGEFVKGSDTQDFRHMDRQPVLAAMFATFHKVPQVAVEFWTTVRDGVGVGEKTDARYVLRNYLMTNTLNKAAGPSEPKATLPEAMYRACLMAWSLFRSNKKSPKTLQPGRLSARPEVK